MTWTAPNSGLTDEDAAPDPPKVPVSKLGDLWLLGKHRLLCGDSTKVDDVARLMNGEKAALMATDPPYLVNYDGLNHPSKWAGKPKKNKDWSAEYGVHWNESGDDLSLWVDAFNAATAALQQNAAWYIWHADRLSVELRGVLSGVGLLCHQVIIWKKNRPVLTRSPFMSAHESCLFGWLKGHKPALTNKEQFTTVWDVPNDKIEFAETKHPTQKPVEIFVRPMVVHSSPGDICYEPFSGSGSQLIAAEKTGRRCYATEINPVFVDVAVQRWEDFTGQKAVLT